MKSFRYLIHGIILSLASLLVLNDAAAEQPAARRLLYVAEPGIRNYVQYGGHGVLVFDIDNGHTFVRRIPMRGFGDDGRVLNVKGICANAQTERMYVSTLEHLICFDLRTDEVLWERKYEHGCDRMAMSPDGQIIYLPSLEKDHWKVVRAADGDVVARVVTGSGSHNTVFGPDGREVYLAGLRSPLLTVANATNHAIDRRVGPFSNSIRPFTVNGSQTLCFVNVNGLLGFEIGDLKTGKKLHRVEIPGFQIGPVKRHGCPSHGIGMTPDERTVWVCDGANSRVHVFDMSSLPPKPVRSIALRDQPGWVTFTIRGDLAYPSTGEVIDTETYQIKTALTDEKGRMVQSEKMLEIDFRDGRPVAAGDQFGIGHVR